MKSLMYELSQSEKFLLDCLSKYYCIEERQAIAFLELFVPKTQAERMLYNLEKKMQVVRDGGYVSPSVYKKPDKRMIDAFWVFLKFFKSLNDSYAHYAATYPSTIFFLYENEQYEIVPVEKGDYTGLSILEMKKANDPHKDKNKITYILAVRSMDLMEEVMEKIKTLDVMFALIEEKKDSIPEVSFFQEEAE